MARSPTSAPIFYSLGCLYYLRGFRRHPHPGASSQEVAIHCLRFPPDPLREKAPDLPPSWSAWVMKLLARDPDDRFPSVAAARQLLGSCINAVFLIYCPTHDA